MICRDCEERLQQLLDGTSSVGPQSLLDCPHCATSRQALERLVAGVAQLSPPTPPPGLGESLTRSLLAEAKQGQARRWRSRAFLYAGFAAAAAVLLLALWTWWPISRGPGENNKTPPVAKHDPAPKPAAPLRDSMARASDAVATLTNRTANDAVSRSRALVPLMQGPAELTSISTGPEPHLEKPLREAAGGVTNRLAPVAESARRAVGLFLRDLPMSRGDVSAANDKPG